MISNQHGERARLTAILVSLFVGSALLGVKFLAYRSTGSTAILADALESIVNVAAAAFAVGGVLFAGRPSDRSHPYGHGKIEFFTAAFEGGLIAFAALAILFTAFRGFLREPQIERLDFGLLLVLVSGIINGLLGWYLLRTGKKHASLTLEADGHHVLSDSWTSLGVIVGLLLVRFTGIGWLDPLVATLVGVNLAWTGLGLVRRAAGGLLDEEDPVVLEGLVRAIEATDHTGIIRIHHLRAIRAGRFHHIDAHLVVPEHWDVAKAHDVGFDFETRVLAAFGGEGEINFHVDPCRRRYCAVCDLSDCAARVVPFLSRPEMTLEEVVRPDEEVDEEDAIR